MNNSHFDLGLADTRTARSSPRWAATLALTLSTVLAASPVEQRVEKLDPGLAAALRTKAGGRRPVLIQPQLAAESGSARAPTGERQRASRLRDTYQRLSRQNQQAGMGIRAWLDRQGIAYRAFVVAPAIAAELTVDQIAALSARADVRHLADDPLVHNRLPEPEPSRDACTGVAGLPWGVDRVRAPELWALGFRGQGVVVAGQDTGYQWNHPGLIAQYRGNGTPVDHNYHWHDAIHVTTRPGTNPCGVNSNAPCDDDNHGTHTMGSMAGEDDGSGFTVGVAPDTRWIGCRNMDRGDGRPSTYLECFDWFLAPTDLNGANPDPAQAPHVINNSWGCPPSEGCTAANWGLLETAVDNLTAAGVLVVVSAGNAGSSCGSVVDPPAIFANAFTVAATGSAANNPPASFSSRGPVGVDGSNRLKPDIAAPGVNTCSTIRGGNYSNGFSGTSMAGPHVAGVAALLMSAFPDLRNNPPAVRDLLQQSAQARPDAQTCGGFPGSVIPNAVTGYGLVDALAAYQAAQQMHLFRDGYEALP